MCEFPGGISNLNSSITSCVKELMDIARNSEEVINNCMYFHFDGTSCQCCSNNNKMNIIAEGYNIYEVTAIVAAEEEK